jgi:hypothetical protein
LKGRRDRIPACGRKGSRERESRKKYLIFYLEGKLRNINFVVPKEKKRPFRSIILEAVL